MSLIYTNNCPVCNAYIMSAPGDSISFYRYYVCPNKCYQLYQNVELSHIIFYVPNYIVQIFVDNKNTRMHVCDLKGDNVLVLHEPMSIDWKNLDKVAEKIKTLIVFS